MKRFLSPGALGLCLLAFGAYPLRATAAEAEGGEKVYQRVLKSVVWVVVPIGGGKAMTGTGSLVDHRRKIILTNYHVVGDHEKVVVLFPVFDKGKLIPEKDFYKMNGPKLGIPGKVIARESKCDLALIQLEALPEGVQALRIAASSPGPGQDVHSVGNPGRSGALWVYTSGKVRQVYHKKWLAGTRTQTTEHDAEVVETQSPTNPGDSGGPLVNNRCELVAVTQGGAVDASLLSLFIDVTEVRGFLASKKLLPKGSAPLGGTEKPDTPPAAEEEKSERLAAAKLKLVRVLAEDGKTDVARERLQILIRDFPKTKAAEEAKELLQKLSR